MLKDFVYKGDGEWADGTIYDPQNGSTYNCVIKLKDENTLDLRGYIGLKTFGRTDVWVRLDTSKKKKKKVDKNEHRSHRNHVFLSLLNVFAA